MFFSRLVKFCKSREGMILIAILIIGIGFRTWQYSDNLIFQSDQSRDALIVEKALESRIKDLPLIGPQARGSNLHLGPVFYYFQYFSGKIFGGSPESFAYPDLFFGILTILLLYFFLRKFVTKPIALGVTLLASTSFFLISFSRFAWNPNSLQFFSTLVAYSFLSALESTSKKRTLFLAGAALATGIIFQLHFVAALSIGGGLFLFVVLSRSLRVREIILASCLVLLVQTPTLVYEFQSRGATAQAFIETVDEKGSRDTGHAWYEKIFRAYQENASAAWLVATGQQNVETILTRGASLKCDKECQHALPVTLFVYFFFAVLVVNFITIWKKHEDNKKREQLLFLGLWSVSFFCVSTLLSYQISTRFFLSITPIFFLAIALFMQKLVEMPKKYTTVGVVVVLSMFIVSNIYTTTVYLKDLSQSRISSDESKKDLVFGTEPKVTLGQLRDIAKKTSSGMNTENQVFVSGESRYVRSVYYILSMENGYKGCYMKGSVEIPFVGNHIIVKKNKGRDENQNNNFGTLSTYRHLAESSKVLLPEDCLDY